MLTYAARVLVNLGQYIMIPIEYSATMTFRLLTQKNVYYANRL
jgi:hypothetical protein